MSFLRNLLRRGSRAGDNWLTVREEDVPDAAERAFYELALNASLSRDGGVVTARDPDGGVTVGGVHFDSVEAATAATRARP